MKHNYISRSLPGCVPSSQESSYSDLSKEYDSMGDKTKTDNQVLDPVQNKVMVFHIYIVSFNFIYCKAHLLQALTFR